MQHEDANEGLDVTALEVKSFSLWLVFKTLKYLIQNKNSKLPAHDSLS